MTSNLKVIISICLSAGLGICWYPLSKLEGMQVESSQLLFFAFSAASLLTTPFMAFQVKTWRTKTLELLVFGLVGGISNAIFHYSLLGEFPVTVLSLFCMGAVGSLFLAKIMKGEPIPFRDFLIMLSLMLASLFMLLAMDGLRIYVRSDTVVKGYQKDPERWIKGRNWEDYENNTRVQVAGAI